MASVDQRIVDLKLNAKQFKTGIQAAIQSLDNLKKNLKMDKAASEFNKVEKAAKNVKFDDLYASVDSISNRFSAFGIIGMSVLNNLANTAVNTGKRILSALTSPLIEGGKRRALNIEQAKFQIEGLGYAWTDVEEDINYGVKDTAYGLDAAAKAASQLLASQVKVGQEMRNSLRGISGVAAMTSSEYEDIANIFTTVAGNGRLMGDQLMQLSSRGLNAAATLGQYLGKSESEIRDMVSKGQIDFQTFANAMDSAFGEHAKKANETFTGSLSNMKAALSRIGADFATPAYRNLRDIFNSLTPVFDGVRKSLEPIVASAEKGMDIVKTYVTSLLPKTKEEMAAKLAPAMQKVNTILINLATSLTNVLQFIKAFVSPVVMAFKQVFGDSLLTLVVNATEALKEFTGILNINNNSKFAMITNLNKTFKGIFTILSSLINIISRIAYLVTKVLYTTFVKTFSFFAEIILTITGHIGSWIVSFKNFINEIRQLESVQMIFSKIGSTSNLLSRIFNKLYETVKGLAVGLTDKAFSTFGVILRGVLVVLKNVVSGINSVVLGIKSFIDRILEFPAVQTAIENLKNIFDRLKTAIKASGDTFKTKFLAVFSVAKNTIGHFITMIKDLISQYVKLPALEEVVATVLNFMVNAFENGINIFKNLKELLSDIFDRIKELGEVSLKSIIENFGKLKDKIVEVIDVSGKLTFLTKMFGNMKDGAVEAAKTTGGVLELTKNKIADFIEWIKTKFADLTVGDVVAAGIGGTFIVFLVQLTKFTSTAEKLTQSLTGLTDWLNGFGGAVTKVVKNFAKLEEAKAAQMKMAAVTDIIKSVVLLAGAVALLATMDQEKVITSAAVLLVLAGALVVISNVASTISKDVSPEVIAKSMVSMLAVAASIFVLVLALKKLTEIPLEGIITRLLVLGVLMLEMAAMFKIISKIEPQIWEGSLSIFAISVSLYVLAGALNRINDIGLDTVVSSMLVLSALMALLSIMTKLSGKAGLTWESAVGIMGIAIALRLMTGSLEKLAKMNTAQVAKALFNLLGIMGGISLVLIATRIAGEHASKAGGSILLISISMILMTEAIKRMADIDKGMLSKASNTIMALLAMFAVITAMTKFAGENAIKAGVAITMMAGSLLLISMAMVVMTRLSDDDLKRATNAILQIMGMFAIIVAATGVARQADKTIKMIAITLGILAGSLAVLAMIEPANIKAASMALSMVIGTFALVVASTGVMQKANVTLLLMAGIIAGLALVLRWLSEQPWENTLASAASLSMLLVSFSASALLLSKIGALATGSIPGAVAMLAIVTAFGLVLAALGGLIALIPDAEEFLANGIPIIQKIGEAIGAFIGGIVGGVISGASASLVTLADNLTAFMTSLQPFLDMIQNVDDSAIDGAKKIVEMVLLFAVADFIDGLNLLGGSGSSINNMSQALPKLGEAMRAFSESLAGVDLNALSVGAEAGKALAEIANSVREGGFVGAFLGSSSEGMAGLAENLEAFGQALKKYGDSVNGLNADAINQSIGPAKSLVEIGNSINGEGGVLQNLAGSTSQGMEELSENLPNLGKALTKYGNSLYGCRYQDINKSIGPVRSLVEIANSINAEGGALQGLIGSTALGNEKFIENLVNIGKALVEYSKSITAKGAIDIQAINSTIEPLKALIEISKSIDSEGGVLQAIVGSTALGDAMFVKNLTNLGEALKSFSDNVTGLDSVGVWNAVTISNSLIEVMKTLEPAGGLLEKIFGSEADAFSKFSGNVVKLGLGIRLFAMSVSGMPTDGIYSAISAATGLAQISNDLKPEGGIMGMIFGGHSEALAFFASNLGNLGSGIAAFCSQVSGIDVSGVDGSVRALSKLVGLSNEIESAGGVQGFLFGDKQSALQAFSDNVKRLGDALNYISPFGSSENQEAVNRMMSSLIFMVTTTRSWGEMEDIKLRGDDIVYFGNRYKTFGDDISGIDFAAVQSGVYWLNELINVLGRFPEISDTSGALNNFSNLLKSCGTDAVQSFVQALQDGSQSAGTAAYNMMNYAMQQAKLRLTQAYSEFMAQGYQLSLYLSMGIKNGVSYVKSAIESLLSQSASTIRSYYNSWREAGEYLDQGLGAGITRGKWAVTQAITSLSSDTISTLRTQLGINSPSTEGIEVGKFLTMGVAIGILKYAAQVFTALTDMTDEMDDKLYEVTSGDWFEDIDLQPVIAPELDLSNVKRGVKDINGLLTSTSGISLDLQGARLSSAFSNISRRDLELLENQNGSPEQVVNNYDFTQNNYSPKALSQIDIYRNTKNQISRLKGVSNA